MNRVQQLMQLLVDRGGSDLHLTAGCTPYFRLQGSIVPVGDTLVEADELIRDFTEILGKEKVDKLFHSKELDCGYSLEGCARFRINLFFDRTKISCVMRALNSDIPSFNQIGLPTSVQQLLSRPRGLMLVTGPTGSGKTTTLASSVDWINENHSHHILTIEDPIEFIFPNKNCLVRQREVGRYTLFFFCIAFSASRRP